MIDDGLHLFRLTLSRDQRGVVIIDDDQVFNADSRLWCVRWCARMYLKNRP